MAFRLARYTTCSRSLYMVLQSSSKISSIKSLPSSDSSRYISNAGSSLSCSWTYSDHADVTTRIVQVKTKLLCSMLHTTTSCMKHGAVPDNNSATETTIKLIDSHGKDIGLMKKSEAESVAADKGHVLTLIDERSETHPVYSLISSKQLSSEHHEHKETKHEKQDGRSKGRKSLQIGSKIASHDLGIKMKKVTEWLEKGHDVKIIIKNKDQRSSKTISEVFHSITETTSTVAVVQNARDTEHDLSFVLQPKSTLNEKEKGLKQQKPLTMEQLKKLRKNTKSV